MEKQILGLDLDGVVYPWHEMLWKHLQMTEVIPEGDTFDSFWIREQHKENAKIPKSVWKIWTAIAPIYSRWVPPQNQVEALNRLSEIFDIVYITHRPRNVETTTYQWLKRYNYPNYDNLVFTSKLKSVEIRLQNCDYYVEDRPHIALEIKDIVKTILYKRVYNQELWDSFPTINDITELPEVLENYEKII